MKYTLAGKEVLEKFATVANDVGTAEKAVSVKELVTALVEEYDNASRAQALLAWYVKPV